MTAVNFSRDGTLVVSGSYDGLTFVPFISSIPIAPEKRPLQKALGHRIGAMPEDNRGRTSILTLRARNLLTQQQTRPLFHSGFDDSSVGLRDLTVSHYPQYHSVRTCA